MNFETLFKNQYRLKGYLLKFSTLLFNETLYPMVRANPTDYKLLSVTLNMIKDLRRCVTATYEFYAKLTRVYNSLMCIHTMSDSENTVILGADISYKIPTQKVIKKLTREQWMELRDDFMEHYQINTYDLLIYTYLHHHTGYSDEAEVRLALVGLTVEEYRKMCRIEIPLYNIISYRIDFGSNTILLGLRNKWSKQINTIYEFEDRLDKREEFPEEYSQFLRHPSCCYVRDHFVNSWF